MWALGLTKPKGLTKATQDITDRESHFSSRTSKADPATSKLFFLLDIISLLGSRIKESEFCKYSFPILMIIDQRSCLAASGNKVVTPIKFHFRNMFYSRDCQTDCKTILSIDFRNKYPGIAAFLSERPGTGSRKLWVLRDRKRRCGHQFLPTGPWNPRQGLWPITRDGEGQKELRIFNLLWN